MPKLSTAYVSGYLSEADSPPPFDFEVKHYGYERFYYRSPFGGLTWFPYWVENGATNLKALPYLDAWPLNPLYYEG